MDKVFNYFDLSFVDMHGILSAVLYFPGCNLNCTYCFNKEICYGKSLYSLQDVYDKYSYIVNHMDLGFVLTGGEPTIHPYFYTVFNEFKDQHTHIGLQTNGVYLPNINPDSLYDVILSVKSRKDVPFSFEDYKEYLRKAVCFYRNVPMKEIRIVDIFENYDDYLEVLDYINPETYKINYVEELNNE